MKDLAAPAGVTGGSPGDLSGDARVCSGVDPSDAELVRRTRGGDLEAFGALVRRFESRCARFARQMLGSREDAEEVVQDVFVRAHRAIDRCEPERFGAWLYRILVNRCRSVASRRRWWIARVVDLDGVSVAGGVDRAAAFEAGEEIDRALTRLSAEQREAFLLKHVEELSYQEMEQVTGASVPALKMRVSRACEALRATLEEGR